VVALDRGTGIEVGADPDDKLNPGTEMLLIGSVAAEKSFFERYGGARRADA
jgi:hypothetical protein